MNTIGNNFSLGTMGPQSSQLKSVDLKSLQPNGLETSNETEDVSNSFKDMLLNSINQVNEMQQDADVATQRLMTGEDVKMAEVLTAVQKADLSFRMMMQIRNKLMSAYQEIKEVRI